MVVLVRLQDEGRVLRKCLLGRRGDHVQSWSASFASWSTAAASGACGFVSAAAVVAEWRAAEEAFAGAY